jgi:general secretion pathway protein A
VGAPRTELGGYLGALGLGRMPFPTTPDAACYFRTPMLEEEMAEAVHCIMARKGFVLVTGEIGLGKSTFVRHLTDMVVQRGCAVSVILNTFMHGEDLLCAINRDFGIAPGSCFADNVRLLNGFLIEQRSLGRAALIVIDDAQNMCLESLELVRMLSNFETNQEKLVQILLCGQPELVTKLATPSIRQLASRIVKHVCLCPMRPDEARSYVEFRLTAAGADGGIVMVPAALRVLYRLSDGNPRRMHLILDRCLYGLVARRVRTITADLVQRAAAESGMRTSRPVLHRRGTRLALVGAGVACLASMVAASVLTRQPARSSPASVVAPAPAAVPASVSRPVAAAGDTGLAGCLQQFALADRDGRIRQALDAGDVGAVRAAVVGQDSALTAFAVPARVKLQPPLEDACLLAAGEPRVVLWRPRDALQAFVFGGRGKGVQQLQQRLARDGYYRYHLDGVAGPRTVTAIADFQTRRGLAVTGYPDALTRFVIDRESGAAGSQTL